MSTVADLLVKISADSSGLRKELNAMKRQIKTAFGTDAMKLSSNVESSFKYIAAAIAGVGVAAVTMSAKMEMTKRAFEVLTGSSEKAQEHLNELEKFAATTPFEFEGLTNASKKLQAYGFSVDAVIPIMTALGDASMAVGLGQEGMDRITLALGQINAKGKITAEEMRQLAETGIPAWDILASKLGITTAKAMELSKKGAISAKEGITALLTGMEERFGGMMDKVNGEIPQSFSNMKDSVASIMRSMGDDIIKALDLKDRMKNASQWMSDFATQAKMLGVSQAFENMVPAGVREALVGIGVAIVAIAVPALVLLGASIVAASPLIVGIGALCGTAAAAIYAAWDTVGPFFTGLWEGIKTDFQLAYDFILKIAEKYGQLVDWLNNKLGAGTKKSQADIDADYGASVTAQELNNLKERNKLTDVYTAKSKALAEILKTTLKDNDIGDNSAATKAAAVAKKAAEAYKRLQKQAHDTSKRIADEWTQTTGTQIDSLNQWYSEELEELNKSKSANTNYQRDLNRLEQIYSEKRRKILHDEAKEKQETFKSISNGYIDIQQKLSQGSLKGSALDIFNLKQAAEEDYKGVSDYFDQIAADFASGTAQQKGNIISSLEAMGIEYKIISADMIDFSVEKQEYRVSRSAQLYSDMNDYYRQTKAIQADIDEAYNKNSLSMLQAVLTERNAAVLASYNAQKAYMDLYYDTWLEKHKSTAEQVVDILGASKDSFKTLFSDILTGAESFGDAFVNFFEDVWQNIVDSFAEKWSANITNSLMEMFSSNNSNSGGGLLGAIGSLFSGGGSSSSSGNSEGGTSGIENAFGSLSTVLGSFGGVVQGGTALLTGFNAIQAIISGVTKPAEATATVAATTAMVPFTASVVAATAALEAMSFSQGAGGLLGLFGFASGGAISGQGTSKSDSIPAMLSNGEYVINADAVRKFGTGFFDRLNFGMVPAFASGGLADISFRPRAFNLSTLGGGSRGNTKVTIEQNNYGDYNYDTDVEAVGEMLGGAVLSALKG